MDLASVYSILREYSRLQIVGGGGGGLLLLEGKNNVEGCLLISA